jgi:hypothetical protein
MTRINVGVYAHELCDQHLEAEYRELPRLWGKVSKSKAPDDFKLGKGHCLWCQQYQGMLYDRFTELVKEMLFRGFKVSYLDAPHAARCGLRPTDNDIENARAIVLDRLKSKLLTMKRPPRWTNRKLSASK